MRSRFLAIAGLLVATACGGEKSRASSAQAFQPLSKGAEVPRYSLTTLEGDSLTVGGSGEPVVLNVWATWCESCREEMAALDSLHKEFGSAARVVGVSVDQGSVEKVRRFAQSNRLSFAIAHDPAGEIQSTYQVVGVPTTFVISRDGRLLWQHTGNIADDFSEVHTAVAEAIR